MVVRVLIWVLALYCALFVFFAPVATVTPGGAHDTFERVRQQLDADREQAVEPPVEGGAIESEQSLSD